MSTEIAATGTIGTAPELIGGRTAAEEIAIFLDYLGSPAGSEHLSHLEADLSELQDGADPEAYALSLHPDAQECSGKILDHIREKMDYAEGVAAAYRNMHSGYIDWLGISSIIKEAAIQLHKADCAKMRSILKDALSLAAPDTRRMPMDTLNALAMLGMPSKANGRTTATFHGAYLSSRQHDWLRGMAPNVAKAFGGAQ